MKKQFFWAVVAFLVSMTTLQAQSGISCGPGFSVLRFELQPDEYWYEISWTVTNTSTGQMLGAGECNSLQFATYEFCVPDSTCTEFKIIDDYGDGIAPTGFYKLYLNDSLIYENPTGIYTFAETFAFNCPPGSNCNSATSIVEGDHWTNPGGFNTWFDFTPAQNGTYQLSTCFPDNQCPTKIWVYTGPCSNITVFPTVLGTIFYSESGCDSVPGQAVLPMFLAGGQTYHFRIGYANGECNGTPIKFNLSYEGPIVGCTDPTACNYNPLASVSADCLYPGDPDCPNAPDLVVLQDALQNSVQMGSITNNDQCYVEEGCLRGYGFRRLIEFTTHIKNIGEEDYFIGQTPASPSTPSDQFIWDPCHQHWHYIGYAEYVLFDTAGVQIPIGAKAGFCVLDLECNDGGQGKYSCDNMGITAHCGDIYDLGLPCQWIDITDIPAGHYTLVVRVNWDQSPDKAGRVEKTYANNWAQVCFILNYVNGLPEVDFLEDCEPYVDCSGVPFGNTQVDCEGVCGGTALKGDWNKDLVRDQVDVVSYVEEALVDTSAISNCRDLFDDGSYNLYDAAVLQECILHQDEPSYWGTRFPCAFPTGHVNPNDHSWFSLGQVDTTAKTVDVMVRNPFNKLVGFELEVSGIGIDSIETLMPEFNGTYYTREGRIIGITHTEEFVKKNSSFTNLFRIHYNETSGIQVCLDSVISVVNSVYELGDGKVDSDSCAYLVTVGAPIIADNQFNLTIQPNPAQEETTLYFDNPRSLQTTVTLTDVQGKVVRNFEYLYEGQFRIVKGNLPSGIYAVQIRNAEGIATGRIMFE